MTTEIGWLFKYRKHIQQMKSACIYKQNNNVLYHLKTQKINKSTHPEMKMDYAKNNSSVADNVLATQCTDMVLTYFGKSLSHLQYSGLATVS